MSHQYAVAVKELYSTADSFNAALADPRINFNAEAGFAMQTLQANDYLAKIAAGNLASLRAAITNVAAIGISLNPARKQAYLVPRKGAVCLDISYMGLMDLATETGSIRWGQSVIVRKNDVFALEGIDQKPSHKYSPFDTDRGGIIGVYVVVKTKDGDYLTHTMPIADVLAIRDRSEAWKSYMKDNSKKCPWVTDESEMVKKTCVKQASKYWPSNPRLESAIHHLNTDGGEELVDMGAADVVPPIDVSKILVEIGMITDRSILLSKRKEWNKACQDAGDTHAWAIIKDATTTHGLSLARKEKPE